MMMIRYSLIKHAKSCRMLLNYGLIILALIAASCTASTASVPLPPTELSRVEMIVAATFTPAPSEKPTQMAFVTTPTPPPVPTNIETEVTVADSQTPSATQALYQAQYTVVAGDALINLALDYDVPIAALQLANDLGSETILHVGQVLNIPHAAGWEDAAPYWVVHIVRAGETVSEIAAAYGLAVAHVVEANAFTEADIISIGQNIILPLEGPAEIALASRVPLPAADPPTATAAPSTPEPELEIADAPVPDDPTPTPVPEPQAAPDFSGDTAAIRMEIFRLLNEQRALYNLAPLVWNDTLASAAQNHADDCYQRGWCGHTGSDGSNYKARMIRAGYDPVRWSECWAWYAMPSLAVAMWMDEVPPNDPHRRTILSTYLTEVGVGVVPGNGNGYYYIADFGTPRD